MKIEVWALEKIKVYEKNPRKIKPVAISTFAATIKKLGFRVPVLIKSSGDLIDGHFRLLAAHEAGLTEIPAIICDDLSETEIKALRISINKTSELAEWDPEKLKVEILELEKLSADLLPDIGFSEEELNNFFAEPLVDSQNPEGVSADRLKDLTKTTANAINKFSESQTSAAAIPEIPPELLNNPNPVLPITPIYTENHQAFIILCENRIDEAWFRSRFNLNQTHSSATDVKTGLSNVLTIEQLKKAL